MLSFEILCTTMHQKNFDKLQEMNIHSNVVFTNQDNRNEYSETEFDGKKSRMITTDTIGVGKNRNLGLLYADADICLFADDDVVYFDDMESRIVNEFKHHPDADVIIFNFESDDTLRKQKIYTQTKKCGKFFRMPWATFKIAFRLESVKKHNIWFTTLFGGGCRYPSGEDSMWLADAKKKGLRFYVSKEIIGKVSFESSSWFTGYDEKYYYGKGAYYACVHRRTAFIWMIYFLIRTIKFGKLSIGDKWSSMKKGFYSFES